MSNRARPATLAEARKHRGLTGDELAVKMGVTRAAVSMWENGNANPGGSARLLLAIVLRYPDEVVDSWFETPRRAVGATR